MALFLGGGRPLLAGIMTLVMVEPLTSSDTPSTRRGSRFKPDTPEDQINTKRGSGLDWIEYSRECDTAEDQRVSCMIQQQTREKPKDAEGLTWTRLDTAADQRKTKRC